MSQTNKNSIVLADLLLQPYALDPGSLEYLIEESTSSGLDGPTLSAGERHEVARRVAQVRRVHGEPLLHGHRLFGLPKTHMLELAKATGDEAT